MSLPPLDPQGLRERVHAGELRQISYSALGDADTCFKRLNYRWDPDIPRTGSEASLVGKGYHAGLEALYGARMRGEWELDLGSIQQTALTAFREDVERYKFTDWETSEADARTRISTLLERYMTDGHQWPAETWEVLGIEQAFYAPLGGMWVLHGYIDLVLRNRNEGLLVLTDHKTSKRKWAADKHDPRKNHQSVFYCWAWWALTGEEPDGFAFDVMQLDGKFERRWAMPSSQQMHNVLEKALGVCQILETIPPERLPANPGSNLCSSKWCDYWSVCPFGEAGRQ